MKTVTILISFIFIVNFSVAQPGTLDSSFGVDGKVVNYGFGDLFCSALQKDGKIIAAGQSNPDDVLMLVRYNNDGSLDSTFGDNGKLLTDMEPKYQFFYTGAHDVAIQEDGKIIIVGDGYRDIGDYGDYDILLVRYNPNGTLDSSFGDNGVVIDDFYDANESGIAIALQNDGKIIVTGQSGSLIVVRYNTDGSKDLTFGGIGWIKNRSGYSSTIAIQNDDKIVVGGTIGLLQGNLFMLIRLLPNGIVDSSFGENGKVITGFGSGGDYLKSIILQPDGKIVAAGFNNGLPYGYIELMRCEANGFRDTTFGDGGKVSTVINGGFSGAAKVLLSEDKIIVSGTALNNFVIARYNKDGSLNEHFGNKGIQITYFGESSASGDAILQPDGKIVVTGSSGYHNFALARYNGNEQIAVSFRKNIKIKEGNSDIVVAHFEVVLNKVSKKDVQVLVETKDVTAVAGEDYKPILRKVTIKAGSTSASIDVKINGDTLTEGNEKFFILLSNPVNAIIGKLDTAVCTIEDDDVLFAMNASSFDNAVNNVTASIKIYPNPVNNHLLLSGLPAATKTKLSIIDMSGNSRLAATVTGSSYNWNIRQLKAGSYILRIENGGVVVSKMFVKE